MERLSKKLADAPSRPTRIIQFGEGNFLRAFLDWQVQKMNEADVFDGGVAVVQPLAQGRVADLEQQDRLYTVLLEGLQAGQPINSHDIVTVVNQTVNPYSDWDAYLALADNPDTCVIVSNTTEAGIAIDPADDATTVPPRGFPAKLAYLLRRRFEAGLPGFLILPCELIDDNGPALKQAVLQCVRDFHMGDGLARWIESDNRFCSTLVDRIVTGFPADRADALCQDWGYQDTMIVKAEPYLLWAIEGPESVFEWLPLPQAGLNAIATSDLRPYHDRKVYLLNAPHTTMAQLARLAGLTTVGETMADPDFRAFIQAQMRDEIAPTIALPATEVWSFAAEVVERFENPSISHSLDAIALNSAAKFAARVLPVIEADLSAGRGLPRRSCLALAGLLAIYGGDGGGRAAPADMPDVMAAFGRAKQSGDYVRTVLSDASLWGEDLTALPGLAKLVADDLAAIKAEGVRSLVKSLA